VHHPHLFRVYLCLLIFDNRDSEIVMTVQGISQCLITTRIALATRSDLDIGGTEANAIPGYGSGISDLVRPGDHRISFKVPSVSDESVLAAPPKEATITRDVTTAHV
jgi:hypothetical protein